MRLAEAVSGRWWLQQMLCSSFNGHLSKYRVSSPWCNEINETFDFLILISWNIHLTQQRGWQVRQGCSPCSQTYAGGCRTGAEARISHRWWLTMWQHLLHSYRTIHNNLYLQVSTVISHSYIKWRWDVSFLFWLTCKVHLWSYWLNSQDSWLIKVSVA